ncbi:Facilitated trehalose transporter Tret1 [Frankliniella fusca]|uniref:Facilitated trehalose transporter Tret1 n=1 Tax=Frankliniella fusca TaxID=407009 RepID=A0AAE1LPH0_9NEOP|nr:Facilitated trehalose transporter Tret1 [Frankliniella fusca]
MTLSDGPPPGARKDEEEVDVDCAKRQSLRTVLPQIAACVAANSFYLPDGAVLGYSAILIPQLELPKSEITVTRLQTAWLTSLMMLVVPVGEAVAVLLMERWGRVRALQLALVPFCIGSIVIALADSFSLILVGKVLVGVSLAVGTSPASIYVTEVARPDLRGALITAGPLIGAAGLLVAYAAGAVVAWRGVSWCCCAVAAVPLLLLTFCCPESPVWLVQTGQLEKAEHSLRRLAPTDCGKEEYAARELQALVLTTRRRGAAAAPAAAADGEPAPPRRGLWSRGARSLKKGTTRLLESRSARRPLWLLCVLMLLQQFSGSYVLLFYAVTFFQDVQSSVDDYTAAALVGLLRLVMAVVTLPLLSRFGRRQLLMWSAALMCASMLTSGFFSRRWPGAAAAAGSADDALLEGLNLEELGHIGGAGARWVPPLCVLVYVCSSCIGVLSVPWILAAELFPQEVRGTGQAVILSLAHVFMFAALQSYRELNAWLGSDGVQWLYATVCAATVLFVWLVVPETHGRTGEQIESFFENHILYLGRGRARIARGGKQGKKGAAGADCAPGKGEAGDAPGKANDVFFLECREEPEGAVEESSCVTHLYVYVSVCVCVCVCHVPLVLCVSVIRSQIMSENVLFTQLILYVKFLKTSTIFCMKK